MGPLETCLPVPLGQPPACRAISQLSRQEVRVFLPPRADRFALLWRRVHLPSLRAGGNNSAPIPCRDCGAPCWRPASTQACMPSLPRCISQEGGCTTLSVINQRSLFCWHPPATRGCPAVCAQRVVLPAKRRHGHVLGRWRLQRLLGPLLLPGPVWRARPPARLPHAAPAVWRQRSGFPGTAGGMTAQRAGLLTHEWRPCRARSCAGPLLLFCAHHAPQPGTACRPVRALHDRVCLHTIPPLTVRRGPPTSSSPMACWTPGAAVGGAPADVLS